MESYPAVLREYLVERMLGPERRGVTALARESGVGATTLSRWRAQARSVAAMGSKKSRKQAARTSAAAGARRPQDWTSEERLRAVIDAAALSQEELGAWLRQRGLHSAVLAQWRQAALRGLESRPVAGDDAKRIKGLEREFVRKEKALAETAALLVLAGKAKVLAAD